ncbi:hypothetical protein SAMN05216464_12924 [Mucilaginibacter pineti]|uniref:Uncharacterized protein n=1 Tax=Mucilaginibacter pineti TaxID=1391627 RepID=A0A1G7NS93_9SPHI|nr:hypothetical protein SAMN05216464_12924 [Mucilaginibacter pineti]
MVGGFMKDIFYRHNASNVAVYWLNYKVLFNEIAVHFT